MKTKIFWDTADYKIIKKFAKSLLVQGVVVGSVVTIIIFYSLTHKEHEKMHRLLKQHGIGEHSH